MKNCLLILVIVLAGFGVSCVTRGPNDSGLADQKEQSGRDNVNSQSDNTEYFASETLQADLIKLANEEYGRSHPNYANPDNDIGTPPFTFVKKIDCEVFRADESVERQIKRSHDTAIHHTIVILRDSRYDLYGFTLTAFVPNNNVLRLQHYGPLTDENPTVVSLPISQRRFKEFPIDFKTGKPLSSKDGRCIFVPYPFPTDQVYWLFGKDPHKAPLQGLYRNDRFQNIDELIGVIVDAVTRQEKLHEQN